MDLINIFARVLFLPKFKFTFNYKTMKVTQEPVTLDKVLEDFIFEIPLYQREYSWELEQVSDLFYDIENANNGHFLGSILLYSKDDNKKIKEVIDGQQRLTSIFLILYGIKKILDLTEDPTYSKAKEVINNLLYNRSKNLLDDDKSIDPRLVTGKRDKKVFKAILSGQETNEVSDKRYKSHKLLLNSFDKFICPKLEKLKERDGFSGLVQFAQKVLSCEFIVMTAEKVSDKILLFKTLNARGIELTQADLIKNEVCNSPKKVNEDEAVELWDEIRDLIEGVKGNIDNFLFYYINSLSDAQESRRKIERKRNIDNKTDSYPPVPEKYIFDVYDEKLKNIDDTKKFLMEIKKSAKHYAEIYNPSDDKLYLVGLKTMVITKCYSLLLRGKVVLSDKVFDQLSKAVECISFRHSIIRNDPKELEKLYYILASKLNSDTDIAVVIEDIKQHPTMKQHEKFKQEFIAASPKINIAKMILERIVNSSAEAINKDAKDIHLEHIMPQKPKDSWMLLKNSDSELYELSVARLGNLTLLKNKLNQIASNNDFEKKKVLYRESRLKITNDLIKYDKWDFDTIVLRQENLFEEAIKIWNI